MSQTSISEISSGGDVSQEDIDELKQVIQKIQNSDGLDRLNKRKFEEVIKGDSRLSGQDIENYEPEYFTRQYFIDDLLEFLGYDPGRGEYTGPTSGDNPDYRFETEEEEAILGEAKPLGRIKEAEDDMEDYLNRKDLQSDYGIATDGVNWTVMKYEDGQVSKATVTLYKIFLQAVGQQTFSDDEGDLRNFIAYLKKEHFFDSADDVALEFKKKKKEVTQDFFDDYIKLVFGSSQEYCLLDAVDPATNSARREIRLFSVELMNKLLFIKFLEDREIIREDLIAELWEDYQERNPRSSFYKESLEPLFFEVMNTEREHRSKRISNDPLIGDIEYLNGGLFRTTVPNEKSYDVENDIIEEIIDRLIQPYSFTVGSEGESLDPSILGKVFEKTINYLTADEEEDRQKIKGAYYTPDDVTSFLSEESLKPYLYDRVKNELTENHGLNEESFETMYNSLDDILANPQNEAIMRHIYEEIICDVKVCDPACGSGHFLTSVLDELFWIRKSFCDQFNIEYENDRSLIEGIIKENVYGVDVEKPAVEIAKLRLWLRILYEADPEDELSKLPNIDYNIRAGNSLIGFIDPEAETGGENGLAIQALSSQLNTYWDDIEDFREDEYEGTAEEMKQEIDELNEEMEASLNKWFAADKEGKITEEIESVDRLREIMDKNHSRKFTVHKSTDSSESFNNREKEFLKEKGFSTYKYTAYINIKPKHIETKNDLEEVLEVLDEVINSVNAEKFEIEREVLKEDLDETGTFHWIMEFEEVVERGGFDIVIGNPPYGQGITSEKEKTLMEDWQSSGCRDICGYFLEREIQLARDGGYISNIIAGSLAVNNSFTPVRDLMRETAEFDLSFFGIRPSKIFDTVDERVCIINGKVNGSNHQINTAKNQRFTKEDRETLFDDIEYASTEGLLLGSKIGLREDGEDTRLPKIGNQETREILLKLKELSEDQILLDLVEEDGDYELEFRTSARYWINALREFPYQSTKIEKIKFSSELDRDFVQLLINSNLFYLYWSVYGNNRDVFKNLVGKLPAVESRKLKDYKERIKSKAEELDSCMNSCYDPDAGTVGEFTTERCKNKIDDADELLGEIFGIEEQKVDFIQNFDSHIRPNPTNLNEYQE